MLDSVDARCQFRLIVPSLLLTIIKKNNTLGVQAEERDKHQIDTANDQKKLTSREEPMNQWNKVQHASEQTEEIRLPN